MIKKSKQQILKHNLKNNIILKNEYKNLIIKSILHNRQLPYKIKILINIYSKTCNIKKNKKICFFSGLHKGIDQRFNFSRHNTNYLAKLGILQNFKIKS